MGLFFSIVGLYGQPPAPTTSNTQHEAFGPTRVLLNGPNYGTNNRLQSSMQRYAPSSFIFCAYGSQNVSFGDLRGEYIAENFDPSLAFPFYFYGNGIESIDYQNLPRVDFFPFYQIPRSTMLPRDASLIRFKRVGWARVTQYYSGCIDNPVKYCDVFVSDANEVPSTVPNARASFSFTESGCPGSAYSINLASSYRTAVARWNVKVTEVTANGSPVVNGIWEKGWASTNNNTMYDHNSISISNGMIGVNNQSLNIQFGRFYKIEKTVDTGAGEFSYSTTYYPGLGCRPTISSIAVPNSTFNSEVYEVCQTTGQVLVVPTTTLPAGAPALQGYRVVVKTASNNCQLTGAALPTMTVPAGQPINLLNVQGFLPNAQYSVCVTPFNAFGDGTTQCVCVRMVSVDNNAGFAYNGDDYSGFIDYQCEDVACEGQHLGRTNIQLNFTPVQLANVDYIELMVSEMDADCGTEYPIIGDIYVGKYGNAVVGPLVLTRAQLSQSRDVLDLNRMTVLNYWQQAMAWMPWSFQPEQVIQRSYFRHYDEAYDPTDPNAPYVNGGFGVSPLEKQRFKVNVKFYGDCLYAEKTCYFNFDADPLYKKSNKVSLTETVESSGLSANLYPNPTSGQALLDVNVPANTEGLLTITDLQGRVIQQINSTLSEGANQLSLDVTEFPGGLYIYKLQTASGSLSGKLQKQ